MFNKKGRFNKKRSEKAVLTVEACIGYTIFMMVVLTFLFMIRIVYVYGLVQHAVSQTAKELSTYTYIYQVSGLNDLEQELQAGVADQTAQFNADAKQVVELYEAILDFDGQKALPAGSEIEEKIASNPTNILKEVAAMLVGQGAKEVKNQAFEKLAVKPLFSTYIAADSSKGDANQRLKALQVIDGLQGVDFSNSRFFEDGQTIDIVVCYTINPIAPIDLIGELNLMNRAVIRGMSGDPVFGFEKQESEKKGSVWDIPGNFERAEAIQKQSSIRNLPNKFNTFSAYDPSTKTATAERTINITSQSYKDNTKNIKSTLRRNLNKIDTFKTSTYGGVTLAQEQIKHKQLIIYIPASTEDREIDKSAFTKALQELEKEYPDIEIIVKEVE